MSSYLFPYSLPGIQFDYIRSYQWNTGVQKAPTGKTSTLAYQLYPLTHYEYSFEFLKDYNAPADIKAIVGLFNAVKGRFDTFLHSDPDFNTVTDMLFGTATTGTLAYQLTATYANTGGPGTAEIVQNLNGTPTLYDITAESAISTANYTIGPTGIVTFTTLPPNGHQLGWSGSFYKRCRFDEDQYDWKKFMKGLWTAEKLTFTEDIL